MTRWDSVGGLGLLCVLCALEVRWFYWSPRIAIAISLISICVHYRGNKDRFIINESEMICTNSKLGAVLLLLGFFCYVVVSEEIIYGLIRI